MTLHLQVVIMMREAKFFRANFGNPHQNLDIVIFLPHMASAGW
ncbi:MAG: hypothetical protein ACLVEU_14115 [Bacteroides cellulosilyticus]